MKIDKIVLHGGELVLIGAPSWLANNIQNAIIRWAADNNIKVTTECMPHDNSNEPFIKVFSNISIDEIFEREVLRK